eukprot:7342064-Prymnesium_polylepis.2
MPHLCPLPCCRVAVIYVPLDFQPYHLVSALYGLYQKGGRGCPSAWMRPQPDGFFSMSDLPAAPVHKGHPQRRRWLARVGRAPLNGLGPSSAQRPLELTAEAEVASGDPRVLSRDVVSGPARYRGGCTSWAELRSMAVSCAPAPAPAQLGRAPLNDRGLMTQLTIPHRTKG